MKVRKRTAKLILNEHEYDALSAAVEQIRDVIESGPDDTDYYEHVFEGLNILLKRSRWMSTGSPLQTEP